MQDDGSPTGFLTPWEADTKFVSIFLATGFLVGEQAQSLLLVGEPSAGKSALIGRFRMISTARAVTDLTSDGIRRVIMNDENNEVRHILVDDFNRLFARRGPVAEQTAALLTSLMTGDAGVEIVGNTQWDFRGRQLGVIAAMTLDLYRDREREMRASGLLSRFYVVKVQPDKTEEARVIHNICHGVMDDVVPLRSTDLGKPLHPRKVDNNFGELGGLVEAYVAQMNGRNSRRGASQLWRFLKAIAFLRGRSYVTHSDLIALKRFSPYFQGMSGKIEEEE